MPPLVHSPLIIHWVMLPLHFRVMSGMILCSCLLVTVVTAAVILSRGLNPLAHTPGDCIGVDSGTAVGGTYMKP